MHFTTLTIAALLAAMPAINAFTMYSELGCTGEQSPVFPCNNQCVGFSGRPRLASFRANSAGQNGVHCVVLHAGLGCNGERFNFTGPGAQCTNADTGTPIQSFRCFTGVGCS